MALNRREFLERTLTITVGVDFLSACRPMSGETSRTGEAPQTGPQTDLPHVLFIAIDDLNDWVAALGGYPKVFTPNLDRLFARGVSFVRAYTCATECNPSRICVMTGLRPSTTGIYRNDQPFRSHRPDVVTLNQCFLSSGYHVVGCGKIYHGSTRFGDPENWHAYFPSPRNPVPPVRPANGIPLESDKGFDWSALDVSDQEMADMQTANFVVGFLEARHEKPFFLACGFERPHMPWYVPQKYFDLYPLDQIVTPQVREDDLEDVPAAGRRRLLRQREHELITQSKNWEPAVRGYLASISFMDACIGRILEAVDRSPHRNIIIALWSDHGFHLGEKLHWQKFTLWEESTRVPLLLVVPGLTEPSQVCERTVELVDLYPTLLDLCGLPRKAGLDGRSLVPLLEDPTGVWPYPAISTFHRNNHAIRTEHWRYIRYDDGSEELYDHTKDPNEWTNLASLADYIEVKRELATWLPQVNVEEALSYRRRKKQRRRKQGAR